MAKRPIAPDDSTEPGARARDEGCSTWPSNLILEGSDDEKMKLRPFAGIGELDAERRGKRAVKADAEAVMVLQAIEVEVRSGAATLPVS